jgi:hypothetical protein
MLEPQGLDWAGVSLSLLVRCQGKKSRECADISAALCPGSGAGGRSGRTPALPCPPISQRIVSPSRRRVMISCQGSVTPGEC